MAMKKLKIGSKIKMAFHAAGTVSYENVVVIAFDDKTITIEDTWHPNDSDEEQNGLFDRKTGKCLNDLTWMGSKRTIQPQ